MEEIVRTKHSLSLKKNVKWLKRKKSWKLLLTFYYPKICLFSQIQQIKH